MPRRIQYIPGAIGAGNNHTLPSGSPQLLEVVSSEITRLPVGINNLGNHTQAQIVAALADHAVHAHALGSQGLGGGVAVALGMPAGLNSLEDAGAAAPHTIPGGGATGVQNNAAAQAHAAGAAPVTHAAAANPVVASVPTRVSNTQFTLDVNTILGDLLTLVFLEGGEKVRAS